MFYQDQKEAALYKWEQADQKIRQETSKPLVNLQKNGALHCLAKCFSLKPQLNFKFKFKSITLKKKNLKPLLKTFRGF